MCLTILIMKGKYSYGDPGIIDYGGGGRYKYSCGKFCSIAPRVSVFVHADHRSDWVTTYPFGHIHTGIFNQFNGLGHPKSNGDVVIGNDVWIGEGASLMSGITIGDGAIIAANSHVVKNVAPYTIVGGNPAQTIKKRFTDKQITRLLEIKWWDWDDEKINQHTILLCNSNIDAFISHCCPDHIINT